MAPPPLLLRCCSSSSVTWAIFSGGLVGSTSNTRFSRLAPPSSNSTSMSNSLRKYSCISSLTSGLAVAVRQGTGGLWPPRFSLMNRAM